MPGVKEMLPNNSDEEIMKAKRFSDFLLDKISQRLTRANNRKMVFWFRKFVTAMKKVQQKTKSV